MTISVANSIRAALLGLALAGWGGAVYAQAPGYGPGYGPMMGPGMMGGWWPGWGPGGMMGQGMAWGPGASRMALVDGNQDGLVSADESAAWHESTFAAFDADGDETVTREEYLAGHMGYGFGAGPRAAQMAQLKEARFKEMDKNGDGKLALDEFLAYAALRHKAADQDGDGKVTVWEFRAGRRW